MKTTKTYQHSVLLLLTVVSLILSACAGLPAPAAAPAAPASEAAASGEREAPASEAPRAPMASSDSSAAPAAGSASGGNYPTPAEPVTAGVTDDNEQWADYLDYLNRHTYVYANQRDVSERYVITVVDESARSVHDATVEIYNGDTLLFSGRTDAGGRVLFHPLALEGNRQWQRTREYRVVATKGFVARSETFARYGADQWSITLNDPARLDYAQLDLLFLMDATGSMDDEINKLKNSMADVADQIAALSERPDVRYGLVAYRDRGDAFVVRPYDFTPNLRDFQRNLAALRADGGGDEPEALNAALHTSLNELSWRNEDTVRLIILVADAPPHLDYTWEGFSYDTDMIDAVRRGIKIFPVGASNLNGDGEYIFRQLAQFTGGKFVFLTYADGSDPSSGPGTETDHDVENYSVDTLDRLVVRLVREELTKLSSVVSGDQAVVNGQQGQVQPSPIPTPTPVPQQLSCTINLQENWHDCDGMTAQGLLQLEQNYKQAKLQLTLDPWLNGYDRARFDITYADEPQGWSVNIGDSRTNNGQGGDAGQEVNDAELQIVHGQLYIYGNDDTPAYETQDGNRLLYHFADFVRQGETVAIEVANERVGLNYGSGIESLPSPYLFALDGQPDRNGQVNQEIYAAFNRTIDGSSNGRGISQVVVTLYPAR